LNSLNFSYTCCCSTGAWQRANVRWLDQTEFDDIVAPGQCGGSWTSQVCGNIVTLTVSGRCGTCVPILSQTCAPVFLARPILDNKLVPHFIACSHFFRVHTQHRVPATGRPPSTRHLDIRVGTSLLAKSSPADYVLASRAARYRGMSCVVMMFCRDSRTRMRRFHENRPKVKKKYQNSPSFARLYGAGSVLRDDEPRAWVNVHLGHNFNHHHGDEPFQRRGILFSPIASISEAASVFTVCFEQTLT
jgi:hypothetical protein